MGNRLLTGKFFLLAAMAAMASPTFGANIFIGQNAAGTDSGADCANAHAVTWFNANATGGNTYRLCGAFEGTPGSTMLTPPSGEPGNVLTVQFEPDAALIAPYWGGAAAGAISIVNKGYITIDGGTNGVIRNTANGTALTYRQASQGIYISGSTHITVKNLTIERIYLNGGADRNATDTDGANTANILMSGNNSSISVENNTLRSARTGFRADFDRSTIDSIRVRNNTIVDHCWGIMMGAGTGGESATDVALHDNDITGWLNWQCPANASFCVNKTDAYHTDGIIIFQPRGNAVIFSPQIYNNYIHGDLGAGSATAYIYCTYGGGSGTTSTACVIFNNLLVNDGANNTWLLATGTSTSGHKIYNNTLIGRSSSGGTAMMLSGTDILVKNNIVANVRLGIGSYSSLSSVITGSDNNVWFNINGGPATSMFSGGDGSTWYTWSAWQALGFDGSGSTDDPMLSSSYGVTNEKSSANNRGANLSSAGISLLAWDRVGRLRPRAGAWEVGAFEKPETGSAPAPPTGVIVVPLH